MAEQRRPSTPPTISCSSWDLHHQRAPGLQRAARSPASSTRLLWQHIRNSPVSHRISSRLVESTCVRRPVSRSVFIESVVRVLLWKGWTAARSDEGVRDVFMPRIVFFRPFDVIPRRSQLLGRAAKGASSGANHG